MFGHLPDRELLVPAIADAAEHDDPGVDPDADLQMCRVPRGRPPQL